VAAPGAGQPEKTLWRSPTRGRASHVRASRLQSWRLWFSARPGPAFASERSLRARPASSSSRAVRKCQCSRRRRRCRAPEGGIAFRVASLKRQRSR